MGRGGANEGGGVKGCAGVLLTGGEERKDTGEMASVGGRMLTGLGCTGTAGVGDTLPGRGVPPAPLARREIGGIWMRAVFLVT